MHVDVGPYNHDGDGVCLSINAEDEINLSVIGEETNWWRKLQEGNPREIGTFVLSDDYAELEGPEGVITTQRSKVRGATHDIFATVKIRRGQSVRLESFKGVQVVRSSLRKSLILRNDLPSGLGNINRANILNNMRDLGISPDDVFEPFRRDEEFLYRGYRIFWRGWKSSFNTIDLVGQWIAILDDGDMADALGPGETTLGHPGVPTMLYSSYPGAQGIIAPRMRMEIDARDGQKSLDAKMRSEDPDGYSILEMEKQEDARLRMIALIDRVVGNGLFGVVPVKEGE